MKSNRHLKSAPVHLFPIKHRLGSHFLRSGGMICATGTISSPMRSDTRSTKRSDTRSCRIFLNTPTTRSGQVHPNKSLTLARPDESSSVSTLPNTKCWRGSVSEIRKGLNKLRRSLQGKKHDWTLKSSAKQTGNREKQLKKNGRSNWRAGSGKSNKETDRKRRATRV